jgi:transposase
VAVIIDDNKRWVFKRKFKNDLDVILPALETYRASLVGIVVESTYNWYWLVDGLMDNGYKVHLAHTAGSGTKSSKKYSDDYRDAFHNADLLRRGELPEGYIYPKEERPLRDLLRKRGMLVDTRTQHLQSLESFISRNLGIQLKGYDAKTLSTNELDQMFEDELLQLSGRSNLEVIKTLNIEIAKLEKVIREKGKLKPEAGI